ncbi:MAG: Spy/CpxP family protein refolding chaperone [Pseudomonadota bacterium]
MKHIIMSLVLTLAAASALAASPTDEQRAQAEQQMAAIAERLALTDDQRAQIEPILMASMEEQKALLAKHGIDPNGNGSSRPNPRQLRSLRADAQALRTETQSELKGILNDEQLAEFAKIQEESKQQMRNRVRGQR